ncbi:hypothetical protein N780_05830 [Pontibacillus chungwhensis BH030062]|uniref:Uncharacterized protein n=1 Tax=Pontibacillus chungwhensis BH030062 TaxID=1385513 RepID=A0A0A2UU73_9BACI|nr:hypothetical protein [Pontibacillus chungwhensis]KGP90293.1 hypothetical protein N780_05830 [Pontibacillus chungwhensis BH030062]
MYQVGPDFDNGILLFTGLFLISAIIAALFLVLFKTYAVKSKERLMVMVAIFLYFSISSTISAFKLSMTLGFMYIALYIGVAVVMYNTSRKHMNVKTN